MQIFEYTDKFVDRHIGPNNNEIKEMLKVVGVDSLETLISQTIPAEIRLNKKLDLSGPISEYKFLSKLREIASKNRVYKSYIGMGYYPTITPSVIQRNILENPGWYTQYTPYQAEISQGRLEALLNYQTMVIDLTGMSIANASLLDEGTSAAEAMTMFYLIRKNKDANVFFVSQDCFPQTIDVLKIRALPLGIEIKIGDYHKTELNSDIFGLLVQYPGTSGEIEDYRKLFALAKEKNIFKAVAADLLSLTLLTPPGEWGADVAVGSTQRFGVPMGFGGPHAAYFATKDNYKRHIPGRIIGVTIDSNNDRAFRMALQTREQHIRREKATSNICTAQVLLAIISGMYAVYHGPKGLKAIAERIHKQTQFLDKALKHLGYNQINKCYFDTLRIKFENNSGQLVSLIKENALKSKINFCYENDKIIGIALNETTDYEDLLEIIKVFAVSLEKELNQNALIQLSENVNINYPEPFLRKSKFLTHPVFNTYHSETKMLRYMKLLENKDLSLVHSMMPLGSCTMKLNAATEMTGITWSDFADIHPFAPLDQTKGFLQLFKELENDLTSITGLAATTLQPNSGAQGEFTGLMIIRAYYKSLGEDQRNIVLIPSSAHGTNPASAVMAGMKVVVVNCDDKGNIDVDDLRKKAELNKKNLAALMVTYPSTHGVFEEKIKEICDIIHRNDGQVYMDGANMNAQVGLTNPAMIGADACHLNLHKTFCIPHGGGGPGVGSVSVASYLKPFLPNHSVIELGHEKGIHSITSAPWGSADILSISYAYIKMMGSEGLTKASYIAILNANYIKARLQNDFKVLYTGQHGRVGHELIFDMREFKTSVQIDVEDIAKRLMDYGYHAPTVSFPVAGTLMVEPTESESKTELDRFCDAMLSIKKEIIEIEKGIADNKDNVLKNAPHTIKSVVSDKWDHSYSREKAAYPTEWTKYNKFWPSVGRVNNAYGDRNLICSCNPISDYIVDTIEV